MVKPEVIRRRLQNLDKYLAYLEKVSGYPQKKFWIELKYGPVPNAFFKWL